MNFIQLNYGHAWIIQIMLEMDLLMYSYLLLSSDRLWWLGLSCNLNSRMMKLIIIGWIWYLIMWKWKDLGFGWLFVHERIHVWNIHWFFSLIIFRFIFGEDLLGLLWVVDSFDCLFFFMQFFLRDRNSKNIYFSILVVVTLEDQVNWYMRWIWWHFVWFVLWLFVRRWKRR